MKKIRATIKEQMLNEFAMCSFTAYDLVKYILTVPSCLTVFNKTKNAEKELPDSTLNRLILACSEAVYCPFKTAEDDDDDFVILPET